MTSQMEREPGNWETLAGFTEEERRVELRRLYDGLATSGENERQADMEEQIRREYALPDDKLLIVTRSRLESWLEMEPDAAKTVATSYDAAMRTMPGTIAMRHVSTVQTVTLEMPGGDLQRLKELIPSVTQQIPRLSGSQEQAPESETPQVPVEAGASRSEKKGWAFWRRG